MNIIDAVLILIILAAGIVGFKRGVFKELVMTVGFFLVFIISFKLKNPLAEWLSFNLPFFDFYGSLKGATSLNIILYQLIAFLIIFSLIMIVFRIILSVTGVFEKILKYTIILGIPSKICGFVVGLVEGYIVMFIVIFVLSQPIFDVGIIDDSKYANRVLNSSPILSKTVSKTNDAIKDICIIQKEFVNDKNVKIFNTNVVNVLLKYKLVNYQYIEKLTSIGKIKINDVGR